MRGLGGKYYLWGGKWGQKTSTLSENRLAKLSGILVQALEMIEGHAYSIVICMCNKILASITF